MLPYKINKELLLKDEEFLDYQHKQFERVINNLCVEIEKTKEELEQYKKYLDGKEVDKITALYFAFNKGWINASSESNIFIPPLYEKEN